MDEHQVKAIDSYLSFATKATHNLSGAIFSARENAPTRDRYVELVRGIAEKDYPVLRDTLAGHTRARRLSKRHGRSARRRKRKVSS
jgi:hypothetical protein